VLKNDRLITAVFSRIKNHQYFVIIS